VLAEEPSCPSGVRYGVQPVERIEAGKAIAFPAWISKGALFSGQFHEIPGPAESVYRVRPELIALEAAERSRGCAFQARRPLWRGMQSQSAGAAWLTGSVIEA
jgi:hypothetical protein